VLLRAGDFFGSESLGWPSGTTMPAIRTITTIQPCLLIVLPTELEECVVYHTTRPAERLRVVCEWIALQQCLQAFRPTVEQHIISQHMLRLQQFGHLRSCPETRLALARLVRLLVLPENYVLIREGMQPKDMSVFFIIHGICCIYVQDRYAGSCGEDEFQAPLGYLSVFGEERATATVVTKVPVVCLVLHKAQGAEFASHMPEITFHAKNMAQEIRQLNDGLLLSFSEAEEIERNVAYTSHKVRLLLQYQIDEMKAYQSRENQREEYKRLQLRSEPDLALSSMLAQRGADGEAEGHASLPARLHLPSDPASQHQLRKVVDVRLAYLKGDGMAAPFVRNVATPVYNPLRPNRPPVIHHTLPDYSRLI